MYVRVHTRIQTRGNVRFPGIRECSRNYTCKKVSSEIQRGNVNCNNLVCTKCLKTGEWGGGSTYELTLRRVARSPPRTEVTTAMDAFPASCRRQQLAPVHRKRSALRRSRVRPVRVGSDDDGSRDSRVWPDGFTAARHRRTRNTRGLSQPTRRSCPRTTFPFPSHRRSGARALRVRRVRTARVQARYCNTVKYTTYNYTVCCTYISIFETGLIR